MTLTIGLECLLDDPAAWAQPDHRVGLLSTVDILHVHQDLGLVRSCGPQSRQEGLR